MKSTSYRTDDPELFAEQFPQWYQRKSLLNTTAYIRLDSIRSDGELYYAKCFDENLRLLCPGQFAREYLDKEYIAIQCPKTYHPIDDGTSAAPDTGLRKYLPQVTK